LGAQKFLANKSYGPAANTLNAYRNGAVGFIDWLDRELFI